MLSFLIERQSVHAYFDIDRFHVIHSDITLVI